MSVPGTGSEMFRYILLVALWCNDAADGFGGKDGAGADISERTLYDVYLRPWRDYARVRLRLV